MAEVEGVANGDSAFVFQQVLHAMRDLGWTVIRTTPLEGEVVARVPGGLRSWGEDLVVKVDRHGIGRTLLRASSSSPRQLFDWGKNNENLHKLVSTLIERGLPIT